ncbi:MAG: AAA family ATPase [Gammaproteobacteria bacterium]|nr:AAA family ATPase [Gammaproteobacteria bacterium]
MYEEHFNFTRQPFQLSPYSDVFYASNGHQKAYSYLEFGIGKREGFIVITGDVGAGKTTLIEHLLANIEDENLITARLSASQFSSSEILTIVADSLGVGNIEDSKAHVSLAINQYLKECAEKGKHILIIVDEAQNIPLDSLEELRMITNYHHKGITPVQIFLLGQPEFRDTLNSHNLEQLRQRVVARYHLGPLNEDEVGEYINYRLDIVRVDQLPQSIFNSEVFPAIYKFSGGIPRIINTICDRALISAYLEDQSHIDTSIIYDVLQELQNEKGPTTSGSAANYEPIVEDVDFLI